MQETLNFINNNRENMTQSKTAIIPNQNKGFLYERKNIISCDSSYIILIIVKYLFFQQKVSS